MTTSTIIAIDKHGDQHITDTGNGRHYCKERKINLDWSKSESIEGTVMEGGVLFSCKQCGTQGALKASEFTLDLKHKMGLFKYEPVGIEFHNCEQHEGQNLDG